MAEALSSRDLAVMVRLTQYARAVEDDPDVPLPWALLDDLAQLIECDQIWVSGQDTPRWLSFASQELPEFEAPPDMPDLLAAFTTHYWGSTCSYPDRTGDVTSVTKISDFLSDRQCHASAMYCDYDRPLGVEREMMVCLPAGAPGRTLRLLFVRGAGRDFTERDRSVLTLLRPHLEAAFWARARSRADVGQLTPRQREVLAGVARGASNRQIARSLGLSEATVEKHLENIYARLGVTNRTAAAAALHHVTPSDLTA